MTRNTLADMHNLLMEEIERLAEAEGDEIDVEARRTEAMAVAASQVTANAANMIRALQLRARAEASRDVAGVLGIGGGAS